MVIEDILSKGSKMSDPSWPFTSERMAVAFDCEGINLGLKGQLTLIQIATMSGFCYIFDLISCPSMIDNGLKRLLESPDVVKVLYWFIILLF